VPKAKYLQTVTDGLYETQNLFTNLADLRLLAIPSSRFFQIAEAIRTEKTLFTALA
jgi:hypothetical protein